MSEICRFYFEPGQNWERNLVEIHVASRTGMCQRLIVSLDDGRLFHAEQMALPFGGAGATVEFLVGDEIEMIPTRRITQITAVMGAPDD